MDSTNTPTLKRSDSFYEKLFCEEVSGLHSFVIYKHETFAREMKQAMDSYFNLIINNAPSDKRSIYCNLRKQIDFRHEELLVKIGKEIDDRFERVLNNALVNENEKINNEKINNENLSITKLSEMVDKQFTLKCKDLDENKNIESDDTIMECFKITTQNSDKKLWADMTDED